MFRMICTEYMYLFAVPVSTMYLGVTPIKGGMCSVDFKEYLILIQT